MKLVSCPINSSTKSFQFGEDGVGGGGPHEGLQMGVLVGDWSSQVYPPDIQGIENFPEHVRIGRHGYLLIRGDLGVSMRKQVHGNAATDVGQMSQLMAPYMAIQQHAVHEKRGRP